MSAWIGAVLLVAGFFSLIQLLGLIKKGGNVVSVALDSLEVIGSPKLSDEEKESKLQSSSKKLFGLFFVLACGGAIAFLIPIGFLWLVDKTGLLSLSAVLDTTVSLPFIIVSTIAFCLVIYLKPRKPSNSNSQVNNYSKIDQTLHQIAFKTYNAQVGLADIEDRVFAKQLAHCQTHRPVFITALPRAGTTLLLECFASVPEFATHSYRDMPFVVTPCLWNSYSKIFQRSVESQERAHGDGMKISPDSPEALEEVLWKTFWPRHYKEDRIIPWDNDRNIGFDAFFRSHLCKIKLLRHPKALGSTRYVSKNNANIARTGVLNSLFPDSHTIIPFRDPLSHATSLQQQHINFLEIHNTDSFASEYMEAIGHYDFGKNLRPIDFDGWFDRRQSESTESITFWLEYWIASYRHLIQAKHDFLNFLNYDVLCSNPEKSLEAIATLVDVNDPKVLTSMASRIGSPRPKQIDRSALPKALLAEVNSVYDCLQELSFNR